MTLELVADLVSEQVASGGKEAVTQPTRTESTVQLRITENIEPQDEKADADEPRLGYSQDASAGQVLEAFVNLESSIPANLAAPTSASASQKRVWTRLP
jgi:hypothetical protein